MGKRKFTEPKGNTLQLIQKSKKREERHSEEEEKKETKEIEACLICFEEFKPEDLHFCTNCCQ